MKDNAKHIAEHHSFKAFADLNRRIILQMLAEGPLTVSGISACLAISRPAVSQHLLVLKKAGLVKAERKATSHFYQLNEPGIDKLYQLFNLLLKPINTFDND